MCGIAGIFLTQGQRSADQLKALADHMGKTLMTRGPDDQGVWVDAAQGIALAHSRLSIIDLSPEGHQPMVSASGRYVVSYNGEIYNYQDLRARLDYPWRGHSDTEVLLAAVEAWGVEKALTEFNGMFGFALWDRQEQTLHLARDRMGEKPVYYGWVDNQFIFASEMKAFRNVPGWPPTLNRTALNLFMRYSYVPAPHSIYQGVFKLMPGTYVSVRAGQKEATPKAYWSFEEMVAQSTEQRFDRPWQEVVEELDRRLKHAVGRRMIADVPLGAFLSGGVDSSTIAALMQAQSTRPIKTFTIGFDVLGFDEAPYAKSVAKYLGTEHRELYVSPRQASEVIPQLPTIYDEPFADASQIPTYLVAKFAREQVTVALSGDGGDELFCGYNRYLRGQSLWRMLSMIPMPVRIVAAKSLLMGHRLIMPRFVPKATTPAERLARKLGNYYEKMGAKSPEAFYQKLCSVNDHPEDIVLGSKHVDPILGSNRINLPYIEWMMMQDSLTYFPGDILTKVDRAAMAVSLETRTPFTDPDILSFGWQLPFNMKLREGKGKWILRQVLYRYVPKGLIERPKAGFAAPIGNWLRGDLKPWAADLLSPETLRQQGFLDSSAVQALWVAHQSNRQDVENRLWNVLMFQSWLENERSSGSSPLSA